MNTYYKVIKSNLSFNEAIDYFKNGNVIGLDQSSFDPKNININDIKFSIDQITSNNWEVLDIDHDMMTKLDNVRDMMYDIGLDIDNRFHHEENMDIRSYWNLFENQFVVGDDNLQYELMKFYVNNYNTNK